MKFQGNLAVNSWEMHLFGIQIESVLFHVEVCSDKCSILYKESSIDIFRCLSSFWDSRHFTGVGVGMNQPINLLEWIEQRNEKQPSNWRFFSFSLAWVITSFAISSALWTDLCGQNQWLFWGSLLRVFMDSMKKNRCVWWWVGWSEGWREDTYLLSHPSEASIWWIGSIKSSGLERSCWGSKESARLWKVGLMDRWERAERGFPL